MNISSIGRLKLCTKHGPLAGIATAAITAVAAVLGAGCATTGPAGARSGAWVHLRPGVARFPHDPGAPTS
jgi:hypothetical protein